MRKPLTTTIKPYNEAHKSLRGWCIWWVQMGASLNSTEGQPLHCINLRKATDIACGSGGMFVQSGDFVNSKSMSANKAMIFYGQEELLGKVNMVTPSILADSTSRKAVSKEGDFVVVPACKDNHEAVVLIDSIEYHESGDVPYPIDKIKHILRKYDKGKAQAD